MAMIPRAEKLMDSFAQAITDRDAANKTLATTSADDSSIWRDLGGAREQDAYEMRLLSLTDPYTYTDLRNKALKAVKLASEESYKAAYKQQLTAGASKSHAKDFALKAGMATKNLQMEAMRLRFPDEDTKTYINKAYKDAKAFV